MTKFVLGFVTALAGAAGVYWFVLRQAPAGPCADRCGEGTECRDEQCVIATVAEAAPDPAKPRQRGRRRRPGRRAGSSGGDTREGRDTDSVEDWNGSDDLDLPPQQIDMEHGGEQQLSNTVIESTMGRNFGAIRRCIMVAQADRERPVRGRMRIGMKIRSTGEVAAVNVTPPGPLASSGLGPCVRNVVGRIRFPRFDGRDMVVTYPVTLE